MWFNKSNLSKKCEIQLSGNLDGHILELGVEEVNIVLTIAEVFSLRLLQTHPLGELSLALGSRTNFGCHSHHLPVLFSTTS